MKHFWFGAGLLTVLLAVSLWLGSALEDTHHDPARDLDKAADAALKEDWDLAAALYIRAEKHWKTHRNVTAALVHHDLVDQIDGAFAGLAGYVRCEDAASFSDVCSQLARLLRSMSQSHGFRWWNLL